MSGSWYSKRYGREASRKRKRVPLSDEALGIIPPESNANLESNAKRKANAKANRKRRPLSKEKEQPEWRDKKTGRILKGKGYPGGPGNPIRGYYTGNRVTFNRTVTREIIQEIAEAMSRQARKYILPEERIDMVSAKEILNRCLGPIKEYESLEMLQVMDGFLKEQFGDKYNLNLKFPTL
jgi:hypothetical protein